MPDFILMLCVVASLGVGGVLGLLSMVAATIEIVTEGY